MKKPTRKTNKKPEASNEPRPKFVMAEPNDDLEAHGWDLKNLRLPSKDSTPDDVWPGRSMFNIEQTIESIDRYGPDVRFVCPAYIQIMLDRSPKLREAALAAKQAGYTKASIAKMHEIVVEVFNDEILPAIAEQFYRVAPYVAQFYAARLAQSTMRKKVEAAT
jgi:hypothetical protein